MLIKSDLGVITGSIGGLTYADLPAGQTVRSRPIRSGIRAATQAASATRMAVVRTTWPLLSSAQRDAWADFASNVPWTTRSGDVIALSPVAMWAAMAAPRLTGGLSLVLDAPTTYSLPTAPTITLEAVQSSGDLTITFDDAADWCDQDGSALLVYAGRQSLATVASPPGGYRYVGSFLGSSSSPPTSPATISARGAMTQGNLLHVRSRLCLADGRTSGYVRETAVIDPPPPSGPLPTDAGYQTSGTDVYANYAVTLIPDTLDESKFALDAGAGYITAAVAWCDTSALYLIAGAVLPSSGVILLRYLGGDPAFVAASGPAPAAFDDYPVDPV
jgi:hypothetical protein